MSELITATIVALAIRLSRKPKYRLSEAGGCCVYGKEVTKCRALMLESEKFMLKKVVVPQAIPH